jgi:hypothetical protein
MNRKLLLLAAAVLCLGVRTAKADAPTAHPRILVFFDHPQGFFDIRDRNPPTDEGQKQVLSTLADYLVHRAQVYLPAGNSLTIVFSNIKLAGVIPLGEGHHERVVLNSTPPLFVFEWKETDRAGTVVASAAEKLEVEDFKDLSPNTDEGDSLRYEKAVLDDWMRNRLAR